MCICLILDEPEHKVAFQEDPGLDPAAYVETDNEQARPDALDLLDEQRDVAAARSAIYQQDLRRYHSRLNVSRHSR